MEKVNLLDKVALIDRMWTPRVAGELNGQMVKLARTAGEHVWHSHADEDELFLVLEGELRIHLEGRTVALRPGEMLIVPRGTRHKPEGEASILLFEPATTRSTGDVDCALTVEPSDLRPI